MYTETVEPASVIAVMGLAATTASIGWSVLVSARSRKSAAEHEARARESDELLRAIVEGAPPAVLMTETGKVVITNQRGRDMFSEGKPFEGQNFLQLLTNAPKELRDAMGAAESSLFTVPGESGEPETFLLIKRRVSLQNVTHVFVVIEPLTREIRRQEVEVWKKLLRTISHELNNSLAPISSIVHSAKLIIDKPEHLPKLGKVFDTIEGRTKHLQEFIEGYVHFARLPKPRLAPVKWDALLERIQQLYPAIKITPVTTKRGRGDPGQLEQVLINLVKNAIEAGSASEDVSITVKERDPAPGTDEAKEKANDKERNENGIDIIVEDRGSGMGKEVLASALLPFYSTKERGTGLGLALVREIIEAHAGKVRIVNRDGGGLTVTCSLAHETQMNTRFTLTHG